MVKKTVNPESFKMLITAVENSTVGGSSLAGVDAGKAIMFYDILHNPSLRREGSDNVNDEYRVVFKVVGEDNTPSGAEFLTGLEGFASIRCVTKEDDVKGNKFIWSDQGIDKGVRFLKPILTEALEVANSAEGDAIGMDAVVGKCKFTCLSKSVTVDFAFEGKPDSTLTKVSNKLEEGGIPVFTPVCYNGYSKYRSALNAGTEFFTARENLLKTGLKTKWETMLSDGLEALLNATPAELKAKFEANVAKCFDAKVLQAAPIFLFETVE